MRRLRIFVAIAAVWVVGLPRADAAASTDPCAGRHGNLPVVVVSSRLNPSMQSAVCLVSDNGTIFVLPGSYSGEVRIVRKHVRIVGLADRSNVSSWPEMRAATPERTQRPNARATMTVGDGGGLTLRMIRFSGGDTQIRVTGHADSLDLSQVQLRGGWDGVVHDSPTATLGVSDAQFIGQKHNGVSYDPLPEPHYTCKDKVFVTDTFFGQQLHVAVLIKNCVPSDIAEGEALIIGLLLQNLELQGQGSGGLLAINSGPFSMANIHVQNAAVFGIAAVGSDLDIHDSEIEETVPRPSDGHFGDGVVALALGKDEPGGGGRQTHMTVDNTHIHNNARAGVSNFGSFLSFGNSTVGFNGFDLDGEVFGGLAPEFVNLGGNQCGAPPDANGCVVQSSGMAPPDSLVEPM